MNTEGENKYILKHKFNHSKHFEVILATLEKCLVQKEASSGEGVGWL